MTPSGIETATFSLASQCLNQMRRTAAPHVTKYNPHKAQHYASLTGRRQHKNVVHRSDATSLCALNVTALPVMGRCLCAALAERCLNVR